MNEGAGDMELWRERVNQDITDLKNDYNQLNSKQLSIKDDIRDLQMSDKLQDQEIAMVKATLSEIKDDTNFIRRRITGAIITAIITAVCGGLVGVAIAAIYG